jgi:hypothetical protein
MAKQYQIQWNYQSSYGGPWFEGDEITLDEQTAKGVHNSSPGVLGDNLPWLEDAQNRMQTESTARGTGEPGADGTGEPNPDDEAAKTAVTGDDKTPAAGKTTDEEGGKGKAAKKSAKKSAGDKD